MDTQIRGFGVQEARLEQHAALAFDLRGAHEHETPPSAILVCDAFGCDTLQHLISDTTVCPVEGD
jgi:hypothetical protein